ncbi:MAG: glycoside hydrolase [Thermoplasmata archaeon]|nr:glycoside hydrolase [Thermoplasmata archaeon]
MRALAIVGTVAVAIVAFLLVTSVMGPVPVHRLAKLSVTVSYNPYPANKFHAPLSDIGLIGAIGGVPRGPSTHAPPSVGSGVSSVSVNALRFIQDGSYLPQSETTIALDPGNAHHIVGGSNDARWFFCPTLAPSACPSGYTASLSLFSTSSDGGTSVAKSNDLPGLNYTSATVPSGGFLASWGDPALAAGLHGTFYYASLAIDPNTGANGVELSVSNAKLWNASQACLTKLVSPWHNPCWSSALIYGNLTLHATTFEDKELIGVDKNPLSAYYGDAYVGWDHFNSNGTSTSAVARCTPALVCTMIAGPGAPNINGADVFVAWTNPVVGKNGGVYVSWCNFGTTTTVNPVNCSIASSPAGGTAFGAPHLVLSYMGAGTTLPNAYVISGYATEQFRTGDIPTTAVDTSGITNNLYYAIAVCVQGNYYPGLVGGGTPGNCGLSQIAVTSSSNGGTTWTTPVYVSTPAVNSQPWATVDPSDGKLAVVYYSTQYDAFNHRTDVVASTSIDHGTTWGLMRVTNVSDEPNADPQMFDYSRANGFGGSMSVPQYGDYLQAVAFGGTLWVLFTGNYQAEQGTFQVDPFLAHAPMPD